MVKPTCMKHRESVTVRKIKHQKIYRQHCIQQTRLGSLIQVTKQKRGKNQRFSQRRNLMENFCCQFRLKSQDQFILSSMFQAINKRLPVKACLKKQKFISIKYLEEYYQEHLDGNEYIIELETCVNFFDSIKIQPLAFQDLNSKNVICSSLSRRPWSYSLETNMKYIVTLVSVLSYTRLEYDKIKITSFQFYSKIQIKVGVIKVGFTHNCAGQ
ncbi:Hypothetical_protein [Hexamita inflata]|uniref:Hypothetical_protein n=2 Tax=Hexamita inflata TaxID=28002 RepID=A0AA86N826_9EUKA|nr:Hypothetical protein HINF_LOCUS1774 [Hexamita inflata]